MSLNPIKAYLFYRKEKRAQLLVVPHRDSITTEANFTTSASVQSGDNL